MLEEDYFQDQEQNCSWSISPILLCLGTLLSQPIGKAAATPSLHARDIATESSLLAPYCLTPPLSLSSIVSSSTLKFSDFDHSSSWRWCLSTHPLPTPTTSLSRFCTVGVHLTTPEVPWSFALPSTWGLACSCHFVSSRRTLKTPWGGKRLKDS